MENASRALIIAGAILIAIVIISILVLLYNQIAGTYSEQSESLTVEQISEYNRRFSEYNNPIGFYGSEILSLANLVDDYNNRLLYGEDPNSSFYKENSITVNLTMTSELLGVYDGNSQIVGPIRVGKMSIEALKNYNDNLEKAIENYKNNEDLLQQLKSQLTRVRSMIFKCEKVTYNNYGRISEMQFIQVEEANK